jgi:hypothetical protein
MKQRTVRKSKFLSVWLGTKWKVVQLKGLYVFLQDLEIGNTLIMNATWFKTNLNMILDVE